MSSNIYTRGGDRGQTSLVDGSRVSKGCPRVEAYGTVDEANSWIGLARAEVTDDALDRALTFLQHRLFNCSSHLATPPSSGVTTPEVSAEDVAYLEQAIDRFEAATGPLTHFVLPGGTVTASRLHVARTVCRRAERRLVSLADVEQVDPTVLKLVNRSSDFLFSAARYANHLAGVEDPTWDSAVPVPEGDHDHK